MEDIKKDLIHTEDGRRAERVVQEVCDPTTGETKRITELFVEPKIQKNLTQRVIEVKQPVVVRREIESVDEATGNIVDRRVESIAPDPRMELREHIQCSAMNATVAQDDHDCYVTREDLTEGLLAVARALKSEDAAPVTSRNILGLDATPTQTIIGDKIASEEGSSLMVKILLGVVAVLAAGVVYVQYIM